jgi:uncharacterized membrane protein YoaT (DUF817 family)
MGYGVTNLERVSLSRVYEGNWRYSDPIYTKLFGVRVYGIVMFQIDSTSLNPSSRSMIDFGSSFPALSIKKDLSNVKS